MISESGREGGLEFPPVEGWHSGIVNRTSKDQKSPSAQAFASWSAVTGVESGWD